MKKESKENYINDLRNAAQFPQPALMKSIHETSKDLEKLSPQDQLQWAFEEFDESFVVTTSFGIQSAVLLHMTKELKSSQKPKVIWVDTGYLPNVDKHPSFRELMKAKHKAYYNRTNTYHIYEGEELTHRLISWLVQNVSNAVEIDTFLAMPVRTRICNYLNSYGQEYWYTYE